MSENEENINQNDEFGDFEDTEFDQGDRLDDFAEDEELPYDDSAAAHDDGDVFLEGEPDAFAHGYEGFENPIGLTQAFAPIVVPEDDSDGASWSLSWSNSGTRPSNGWDQIVPDDDTPDDWHEPDDGMFSQEDENVRRHARPRATYHAVMEYDSIPDEEYERAAAETVFNERAVAALAAEKQAKLEGADAFAAAAAAAAAGAAFEGEEDGDFEWADDDAPGQNAGLGDASDDVEADGAVKPEAGASSRGKAAHAKHSAGTKEISVHERKSRRTRRTLIVIIVLLLAVLGAAAYFLVHWFTTGQTEAVQQEQSSTASSETIANDTGQDASTTSTKKTEVPNLINLLGKNTETAIRDLGHGATVKSERAVDEEGSIIKRSLTVPLTDEPADTKTGTPTVYLGLDQDGNIVQAGYSTSTASLGFGAIGFSDAVQNEHVIEKTLRDAGVSVDDGAAVLPSDKMEYSTYDSDGTTLKRERHSFSGTIAIGGVNYTWSAVLAYDYANANLTGNLADTVRVIYVYIARE